jgi:hypothetical protein
MHEERKPIQAEKTLEVTDATKSVFILVESNQRLHPT